MLLLCCAGCTQVLWRGHDPSRQHTVTIVERGDKQWLTIDERKERKFDAVVAEQLVFSPDGQHHAYPAQQGRKWFIVIDGIPRRAWSGIGELAWGAKGLAYSATDGERWYAILGEELIAVDAVVAESFAFSRDGRYWAFSGQVGNQYHVFVNGRRQAGFDEVGDVRFATHAPHHGYLARRGSRETVVIDGRTTGSYERVVALNLAPRGSGFAFLGRQAAGKWRLVSSEGRSAPYVAIGTPFFSPDGRHLAALVKREGQSCMLRDLELGPCFDGIEDDSLSFSPDSRHLAYVVTRQGRQVVVVDDEATEPGFVEVAELQYSPAGNLGYLGRNRAEQFVIRQGTPPRSYAGAEVTDLHLTSRGAFYLVHGSSDTTIVHSKGTFSVPAVVPGSLVVLSDGEHWVCVVVQPNSRRLVVVADGRELASLAVEEIVGTLLLDESAASSPQRVAELLRTWAVAELKKRVSSP